MPSSACATSTVLTSLSCPSADGLPTQRRPARTLDRATRPSSTGLRRVRRLPPSVRPGISSIDGQPSPETRRPQGHEALLLAWHRPFGRAVLMYALPHPKAMRLIRGFYRTQRQRAFQEKQLPLFDQVNDESGVRNARGTSAARTPDSSFSALDSDPSFFVRGRSSTAYQSGIPDLAPFRIASFFRPEETDVD